MGEFIFLASLIYDIWLVASFWYGHNLIYGVSCCNDMWSKIPQQWSVLISLFSYQMIWRLEEMFAKFNKNTLSWCWNIKLEEKCVEFWILGIHVLSKVILMAICMAYWCSICFTYPYKCMNPNFSFGWEWCILQKGICLYIWCAKKYLPSVWMY